MAKVVYLVEKNRLPLSACEELTQALADPEHVFAEAAFTAWIALTIDRRTLALIGMVGSSLGVPGAL
jgi:hypothetical protein